MQTSLNSESTPRLRPKRRWPRWLKWALLAASVALLIDAAVWADFPIGAVAHDIERYPLQIALAIAAVGALGFVVLIGAMQEWRRRTELYRVGVRALLILAVAVGVAIGLGRIALQGERLGVAGFFAGYFSLMIFGGAIGAFVGHAFENKRGGMARRGTILGVLVAAILPLFFLALMAWLLRDFTPAG